MSTGFEHERRRMIRVNCVIEVQFSSNSPLMKGRLTDINLYGIFIDTTNTLPPGTQIDLRFTLPDIPEIITKGKVIWVQERVGMGIEFFSLSEANKKNIEAFVQKVK